MTNADKFKSLFGLYATELWAMPEKDFLKWLNSEAINCSEFPNNSDTISRQAAIEALEKDMASLDHIIKGMSANDVRLDAYVSQRNQVNYDIYTINNLPTAQPKSGQWISADAIFGGVPFYCSECGENTRDTVMGKPRWNYCPMCGADMRGEQDDSV